MKKLISIFCVLSFGLINGIHAHPYADYYKFDHKKFKKTRTLDLKTVPLLEDTVLIELETGRIIDLRKKVQNT